MALGAGGQRPVAERGPQGEPGAAVVRGVALVRLGCSGLEVRGTALVAGGVRRGSCTQQRDAGRRGVDRGAVQTERGGGGAVLRLQDRPPRGGEPAGGRIASRGEPHRDALGVRAVLRSAISATASGATRRSPWSRAQSGGRLCPWSVTPSTSA